MRPADVLRQQADFISRLDNPNFARGVAGHLASQMAPEGTERYDQTSTTGIASTLRHHMQNARAYRVEEAMNDLVWERANEFNNDQTLIQPPSSSGFVVFDKPLAVVDVRGRIELTHVLTWAPVKINMSVGGKIFGQTNDGIYITTWNDASREMDEVGEWMKSTVGQEEMQRYLAISGPWFQSNSSVIGAHWPIGPATVTINDSYREWIRSAGDEPFDGLNMYRFYVALFGMLSEILPGATRTEEYPERVARRQADRAKIQPVVDVIKLRQVVPSSTIHPGTGSPIKVQYHVKAFPRTIHRGTARERVVMVRGHWRGPEDGPVSERSRIYDLSR